jgi:alkanesulfonate monooxygenase SsuD/methylene tetrahydromethanopterin reductase-like flavin-dependent oxidoreductase (luciferase family)
VLVPGDEWGDESAWIAQVADTVSGGLTSVTLLVNGGSISLHQDVPNSLQRSRPVLVMAGSGRTADMIAAALEGSQTSHELTSMINTGLIRAVQLNDDMHAIEIALKALFESPAL